jgi:hypothetical protein
MLDFHYLIFIAYSTTPRQTQKFKIRVYLQEITTNLHLLTEYFLNNSILCASMQVIRISCNCCIHMHDHRTCQEIHIVNICIKIQFFKIFN